MSYPRSFQAISFWRIPKIKKAAMCNKKMSSGNSLLTKRLLIMGLGTEVTSIVPWAGLTIVLLCGQLKRAKDAMPSKGVPSGRMFLKKTGGSGSWTCHSDPV